MKQYVVVWLDSSHAQFFNVHPERFDESTIWMKVHEVIRSSTGAKGARAEAEQQQFFADVAHMLSTAEEVLVVGPMAAKLELVQYAYANAPTLNQRIVGIESVERPSDPTLAQFARRYFVPAT